MPSIRPGQVQSVRKCCVDYSISGLRSSAALDDSNKHQVICNHIDANGIHIQ